MNNKLNKSALWAGLLFSLIIAALVLLAVGVPQDIQRGIKGQASMWELDGIQDSLLKMNAVSSRLHFNEEVISTKNELEKLAESTRSRIYQYENIASYNAALRKCVVDFTVAYNRWVSAENQYSSQYSEWHGKQHNHVNHDLLNMEALKNNTLFHNAMQLLNDGEMIIHADITQGQQASQILQWLGALFVIYFYIVVVLFQRQVNRDRAAREKNIEVTLRSVADAVIATDIQGNITRMNPEAERLTGCILEEVRGRELSKIFRVVHEHSDRPVKNLVEQVIAKDSNVVHAEGLILTSSNESRYQIYQHSAPIHNDSAKITGVVTVFRDITPAQEIKKRLSDNASRLQHVIDGSMDAVIVTDEHGMVEEWNPAAESMFGWSHEEIKKQPIHESIIPQEFQERHLQGIQRLVDCNQLHGKTKRIEIIALHRDGYTFPIELAMTSVRSGDKWRFNAFIRDLTDLRNKEKTIQKKDALIREGGRAAKLGYWEFDRAKKTLECSDEIYRIFGMDPDVTELSYKTFINTVHAEDRERVDAAHRESLKHKTRYDSVFRIVANGELKVVHEQYETIYDDDGEPLRSVGMVQDITEHANNTDELRLAATMFKTHAGILVTEKDGTIIRVNPAFEEMTGYSSRELIGKNPQILHSGKQDAEFYRAMWHRLSVDGMWQGELWNKRKDGSLYAEWLTLTAVKDADGEVTHYVGTSQDITERKQAEEQLEHLAYHDDLTSLANRRLLRDMLKQNIASCKRHNEFGAVLLLDLDHFKDLNDSLGHSAGDEILCQVASRLTGLVREEDTVARLGGDEFVVVLSSVDDEIAQTSFKVQAIAEKIRMSLAQPYKHRDEQCYSNVSIGVTLFPENSDDIDDILKHADTALYRAKDQGRNAVCFYQPSMQHEVDERLAIGDGLRNAINNNEFILHYQPQVNGSGEMLSAEALIRWQHPELGMVSPDKFISIAEDTGMILDIGQWVLEEAARQMVEWCAAGISDICKHDMFRVAVNVSPRQFRQEDFVTQVLAVINQADVPAGSIELEVTESMLMDDLDEVIEKMQELRSHGVRISIDDFGTGYSSLSYLKKLPLDQLKIDQSFVRDIAGDDAVVVETIISMADHLGLNVIAEGVETKEQLGFLMEKGCSTFQGYYFDRPLNAEDFSKKISEYSESLLLDNASSKAEVSNLQR